MKYTPTPHTEKKVPGSTSVGTYLQESLGFLSQSQPEGGWDTGVPAEAGGSRRVGSSLGMAFLSGVCAGVFLRRWGRVEGTEKVKGDHTWFDSLQELDVLLRSFSH